MSDTRPIGIFDSGIGGLTVLCELVKKLPAESFIYLGDTARVPYGTKSKKTVVRYSMNNIAYLLSQNVKMVIVACNTASSYALDVLSQQTSVPVIGVIEGGVEAALLAHKSGAIGVIGTEATIGSGVYEKRLTKTGAELEVTSMACPLFVALAEEGWTENDVAISAAQNYLGKFSGAIDTLVLGCTHYPMLKKVIAKVVGESVTLIDSAEETAKLAAQALADKNLQNDFDSRGRAAKKGTIRFIVTDSPQRSTTIGQRMVGNNIQLPEAELIDITRTAVARPQRGAE